VKIFHSAFFIPLKGGDKMNVGENIFTWFQTQAQYFYYIACIAAIIYLFVNKKIAELIGFVVLAAIAAIVIFNPMGAKDFFVSLGDMAIGNAYSGATTFRTDYFSSMAIWNTYYGGMTIGTGYFNSMLI